MLQINIDMEMPNKCGKCRFASAYNCKITDKFIEDHDIIPEHCPLKEKDTESFNDVLNEIKGKIEKIKVGNLNAHQVTLINAYRLQVMNIIDKYIGKEQE